MAIFNQGFIELIKAHAKGDSMKNRNAIINQLAYLQEELEELQKIFSGNQHHTQFFQSTLYNVLKHLDEELFIKRFTPICLAMEEARKASSDNELPEVNKQAIQDGLEMFFSEKYSIIEEIPAEKIFTYLLFYIWESDCCISETTWDAMKKVFIIKFFELESCCNG